MNARVVVWGGVALTALIVQEGVLNRVSVLGVHPDTLLLVSICVGIVAGRNAGSIAGFVAGLVSDMFLPSPLGISALAYAVAGYVAGSLSREASDSSWVASVVTVAASVLAVALFVVVSCIGADARIPVGRAVTVAFVVALANAFAAPLLVLLLGKIGSLERHEVSW